MKNSSPFSNEMYNKMKEIFFKCLQSLNLNKDGTTRIYFPKKDLLNITADFLDIIKIIRSHLSEDLMIDQAIKILESMRIIVESERTLTKENGIGVFSNLISAFEWMLNSIIDKNEVLKKLINENKILNENIESLEKHVQG